MSATIRDGAPCHVMRVFFFFFVFLLVVHKYYAIHRYYETTVGTVPRAVTIIIDNKSIFFLLLQH